ncbi:mono/diheme cytochrome c family protein [Inquilinus ginsengisoli]|uniref:Mono/diheme cytochrome c family protein n=1 Tax=Inquilinus ginsengisoli TaxID=363840 RepID=A0ABU1JTU6_9PROT|nr:cytochrome c [Inquilinus ginsengisoli]MDR6292046.1 mono/diheme cytochrome c family protein [Inquilinus ginsengisoli]
MRQLPVLTALGLMLALGLAGPARAADPVPADPASADPVVRGAYVFAAGGCAACHTAPGADAKPLAGGRALKTPFGTFYTPNITPDPDTGIGKWSEDDFRRAMRQGVSPQGDDYYPAFPYTSFTGITDRDLDDLWAYLRSVQPVHQANQPHELGWPFSWRSLLPGWRLLNFTEGPPLVAVGQSSEWYRGAYLVRVLGHCGECHTPRDLLGGLNWYSPFSGNPQAPDGDGKIPNITPDPKHGIGEWSDKDIAYYLETGGMPDGDFAGGAMVEVIKNDTSKLTDGDRQAIATYLKSLTPLPGR